MNEFVRAARLESDYKSMLHLTGPVIFWRPVSTEVAPVSGLYPDKYIVAFNIRAPTVNGDANSHMLEIDCSSPSYPRSAPVVRCQTPVVLHPHFYNHGQVCLGGFPLEEYLAELCIRLARFLQFDPMMINPDSIASHEHNAWYERNRWSYQFDHQPLPTLPENVADAVPGFNVTRHRTRDLPASPLPASSNSTSGQIVFRRRNPWNSSL